MNIDLTKNAVCDLSNDFNTYIVNKEKFKSLLNSNTLPSKIHFYEWSDLNQEHLFETDKDFFDFLTKSHIWSSYAEDQKIKSISHIGDGAYVICKIGKKDLIIESSFESLKLEFEKSSEPDDNKRTTVHTATTALAPTQQPSRSPFLSPALGYCGYGGYDGDDYDCWE